MSQSPNIEPTYNNEKTELGTLIDKHVTSMSSFFDLLTREIEEHKDSDWENLVFLVESAKAWHSKFAGESYEIYGGDE